MCSEIDQFSLCLRGMCESIDNQQISLVNEEEKSSPPGGLKNPDSCQKIGSEFVRVKNEKEILEKVTDRCPKEEEDDKEREREIKNEETPENSIPSDDDDGFKTPTSSDHKIPARKECPPAPSKSRTLPSKHKRKASIGAHRSLRFDDLVEVESLFRPVLDEDNAESKRSRKDAEIE